MRFSDKTYQEVANEALEVIDDILHLDKEQELVQFERAYALHILSTYVNLYNLAMDSEVIGVDTSNRKYLH